VIFVSIIKQEENMGKRIIVNKLGSDHFAEERNNQDFCVSLPTLKMVLDGCGSQRFSEIGTRLFAQLFTENMPETITKDNFEERVKETFTRLISIFPSEEYYASNLSFTILACFETEEEFIVFSCGDGYIVIDDGEKIGFMQLDDGEFPKYYIYNYVKKENLQAYQEGVSFSVHHFSKDMVKNVGVATDGLRFYEDLDILEKNKLRQALQDGKEGKIKILINRNHPIFKDDITICF